mmetsp:Transcript_27700/g.78325  ORF Transcript_27700/g.78325 Transcript_27700/m.78325 type:complete len:239 (-) Transcript_27700:804-1520(-)
MNSWRSSLTPEYEASKASALMISCIRFSLFSAIHASFSSLLWRLSPAVTSFTTARAVAMAISRFSAAPNLRCPSSVLSCPSSEVAALRSMAACLASSSIFASRRSSSMRSFSRFTSASFFSSSAALLVSSEEQACMLTSSRTSSGRLPRVSRICSSISLLVLVVTVKARDSSSREVGMLRVMLSSSHSSRLRVMMARACSPKWARIPRARQASRISVSVSEPTPSATISRSSSLMLAR